MKSKIISKIIGLTLVLSTNELLAAPTSRYCRVNKSTVLKIEHVRTVDMNPLALESRIKNLLTADRCVSKRLADYEIVTLSKEILSYKNKEDSAGQIIGEFLAQ